MMLRQNLTLPPQVLALLVWVALSSAIHIAVAQEEPSGAAAIRAIMATTWDKPDAKLDVDPVVVEGSHALASWTQGRRGGRALLRKEDEKWKVVLCSGDPLKYAASLEAAGLPTAAAVRLAQLLNDAESKLPAERVALFSTFEGLVKMDEHPGHHP